MKSLYILLSFISFVSFSQVFDNELFTEKVDEFLKENVKSGLVDYVSIKSNPQLLNELTEYLKITDISSFSLEQKKAFWINAYNITVISSIIDKYPISSPQDKVGFFDIEKYTIAGKETTINDIENKELRAVYNDPRLHFVLVCGAVGCPKLVNYAYRSDKLNSQLDAQTTFSLNDLYFIRVNDLDEKVEVSEIFNWYKSDFGKGKDVILNFINQYRSIKIPLNYSVSSYEYDWKLNQKVTESITTEISPQGGLQNYTPSVLLKKGQLEVKVFNNLYTDKASFNANRELINGSQRQTYFTSFIQTLYGLTPFLNVGIDAQIKSVRKDVSTSSLLALFKFERSNQSRTALSYIGPKIKISPTKKLKNLSVQSSFFIPVAKDQQGAEDGSGLWLSHDGFQWWTQMYYDQKISDDFRAFFEVDAFIGIDRKFKKGNNNVLTPVKGFLSYFPTNKITLYGLTEFGPSWGGGKITGYYTQLGVGGKYQIIKNLEFELLYSKFPTGKNTGAGSTYNVGLRFLR